MKRTSRSTQGSVSNAQSSSASNHTNSIHHADADVESGPAAHAETGNGMEAGSGSGGSALMNGIKKRTSSIPFSPFYPPRDQDENRARATFPATDKDEEEGRARRIRYSNYAGASRYDLGDYEGISGTGGQQDTPLPLYYNHRQAHGSEQNQDSSATMDFSQGQETRRRSTAPNANPNGHYSAVYPGYEGGDEKSRDGLYPNPGPVIDEDGQGKEWGSKGFGAGPGIGGRRGLPPMQRRKGGSWIDWAYDNEEAVFTIVYTLLSMFTRYYKIGWANYVVWDEAHFGKFGSHYINRDFYHDVHPPLGKMLVGLAGLLSGYNGGFDFTSGSTYPAEVPYTAMRVMLATFGVALVPLAWWTAGEFGWSRYTRHFVTICVLSDLAWICISRFILLDSLLLFFTFTTVLGLVKFHNQRHYPFGDDWWLWLVFTGLSIGCVCSVKWVGFFVTALVGLYTVQDLWQKFGDLKMPINVYIRHWMARVACLIFLPFCVYAMCFKIHFLILDRSGPGDAQMSSLFQAHLRGNTFADSPLEVAYGSQITIKNFGYGGGLLHSHVQTFPAGSTQQQVTCYHYKDDNNNWLVKRRHGDPEIGEEEEPQLLKDGDVVRLVHAPTIRSLHSHTIPAPITKTHYEVSGYGNATIGDINDNWVVEVVDDMHLGKRQNVPSVHALTTRIRFRHENLGCYLRAANVPLPQWGFKQIEVTCDRDNNPKDVHTYWNIESHWNEKLPKGDLKLYRSPFWKDFWHLNVAMMTTNNALVPDPDKFDVLASKPTDWPFLRLGLRMCGWGDAQIKYYLIGNPIVWWGSTVSLLAILVILAYYLVRMQRQFKDWAPGEWEHYIYVGEVGFIGWVLQYLPYLIMGRVTYLHHYLPTLWFAVLVLGHVLDITLFGAKIWKPRTKMISFIVLSLVVTGTSWWFRAAAWGMPGPVSNYWGLGWRGSWNLYDGPI